MITLDQVWEQLAEDIFLANHNEPLWYWADANSVHVLEFWLDFDPNIFFILLHTSPHEALLGAIRQGADNLEALQTTLDDWYTRTQLILRFHLRHPASSVLLDSSNVFTHTSAYLEALAKRWQLPLEIYAIEHHQHADDAPVAIYLVDKFLKSCPQALSLHNEVQASLFLIGVDEPPTPTFDLNIAFTDYFEARSRFLDEQADNASLRQIMDANHRQLAQTQEQAEQYQQELLEARSRLEISEKENQLLLAQLHQTQEDFEKQILEGQAKNLQLEKLSTEHIALTAKYGEQTKLASERKAQAQALAKEKADLLASRDALNKEKTDLTAARDALAKEKTILVAARDEQAKLASERKVLADALAKEKADLLASREALSKEKIDLTAARDALAKEKTVLVGAHDEQTKLANERKVQIDTLTRENSDLLAKRHTLDKECKQQHSKLDESENENQRLLIQLHQTQEELEGYLLRYQAAQSQLDEQRARLQKMLKQQPDYWDFDTLEINVLESDGNQQVAQWRLTELYIGGRLISEIRFKTCLANGLASIVIQRTEGTASPAPLLRWPNGFATAEELPCIPTRGLATQGNNAILSGLSTSDWNTLQHLAKQLAGLLAQPTDGRVPKQLNAPALRNGLLAFAKTLAGWPIMLRHDSIQLQETLRTQGYERLVISLSNLSLGHHHWPAFDYRLATVDIEPYPFGQNPRLEFPDGSARDVLQNWFAESDDSHGPRLELRFAQPNAMDIRVWGALSQNDQQLISALIKVLPLQLEELRQAIPNASRPWQDWQTLADTLKNILASMVTRKNSTLAGVTE
ncbi:hypothetical protein [Azomonas macrocytogenes]|uniref:Uncharacterized protein n=1 Tax=Azomonas macrocytogenes TaxID=69962 RepID=A0A839SYN7_AZOMA|nr:hypothetical protein [Azomonas macrocytogenes]MBB3102461.1 hypothetical protein [Azomonas macrocytogenes]